MLNNLFSDFGLIFFVSWSFVLARLSVAAFGRDLVPLRIRHFSKRLSQAGERPSQQVR